MIASADPDPRSRALKEAIERQAVTAEILEIIASSPTDTQPVFDAIVRSGLRLFADAAISIALPDGDKIRAAAVAEHDAARAEAWRNRFPFPLNRDYMHGVAILDAKTLDIADVANAPPEVAVGAQNFLASGYRAITTMPMMRGDAAIGALSVVRRAPGPLSDEQLALLKTFAAQAVIAIENTRLLTELRQRTDDLTESLEQQTASNEVLQVISSSPGALEPVFNAMLANATRICEANYGMLYRREGDMYRTIAMSGVPDAYAELRRREPLSNPPGAVARLATEKQTIHIADISQDQAFADSALLKLAGARTLLTVPMVKDNEVIGAINIYRQEVRPFTEKQIELVTNFAAQAVIAIENTRLLNELRQRTDDLSESLEQQTATADVLRVISSSPTDLGPIFDAIVENAPRLCDASNVSLHRVEGHVMRQVASYGAIDTLKRGETRPITPGSLSGRAIIGRETVHVDDALAVAETEFPDSREAIEREDVRTALAVPLMQGETPLGAIVIRRTEVRPFSDKQISLLKTFADQAVIAIENARLFSELRQRTDDLTESLEQQTATSEVLQIIASSPADTQPVFDAIVQSGLKLFPGALISVALRYEDKINAAAVAAPDPARVEAWRLTISRTPLARDYMHGAALLDRRIVDIPDGTDAPAEFEAGAKNFRTSGNRAITIMPMMRGGEAIGLLSVVRPVAGPLSDKQLALLKTFAAQAVIAIENARLFNELRQRTDDLSESLEQQTATSEVLKVISFSPGDLEPVFATMLQNAVQICGAKFGTIYRVENDALRLVTMHGVPAAYAAAARFTPFRPSAKHSFGRMMATKEVVQIADVAAEPLYYEQRYPPYVAAVEIGGVRTFLTVPMLKETELIGAVLLARQEVRPFSDKQIEVIKNFAAQAVIAIENTRLLTEVRQQASQLEAQSEELRTLNQGLEQRVDEQVGEIERMGRLRRFLPPQVADLIVSSGSEKLLESHRREITALFCDLRGFTGFSETSDPEDVMALLREYHKAIGEIIFRHGGTLERFAGDGVMVIFGDPVPLPNPALSAVQMALEMRAAIGALIDKWSRLGHELGFGIGLAHGYATLGTIGFEGRFDYAAIGTVSNVASRLCDEAQPGQILVSPRVLLAVENTVAVEPVREMTLKGIRRPMLVHNVIGTTMGNPGSG